MSEDKKFSIKIHSSYRPVVAICDLDLVGKKFIEGKRILFIRENFYKDKEVDEKEAIKIIQLQARNDATFNIAGTNATNVAIKAGIISKENLLYVKEIPFSLTLV